MILSILISKNKGNNISIIVFMKWVYSINQLYGNSLLKIQDKKS